MFEVCRHPHVVTLFLTLILNTCPREGNVPRHVDVLNLDHKPTPQPSSGRQVTQSLNLLINGDRIQTSELEPEGVCGLFRRDVEHTVFFCGCLGFTCGLRDGRRRHSWTGSWTARLALVFF